MYGRALSHNHALPSWTDDPSWCRCALSSIAGSTSTLTIRTSSPEPTPTLQVLTQRHRYPAVVTAQGLQQLPGRRLKASTTAGSRSGGLGVLLVPLVRDIEAGGGGDGQGADDDRQGQPDRDLRGPLAVLAAVD